MMLRRAALLVVLAAAACARRDAAAPLARDTDAGDVAVTDDTTDGRDLNDINDASDERDVTDVNDITVANDVNDVTDASDVNDVNDATVDVTEDVTVARDATDAGACAFDVVRPPRSPGPNGFVRFIHLARGVGPVRFVARNQPLYSPAHAEVVVPEGVSSAHVELLAVSYTVQAYPAGDAGVGAMVFAPDDAGTTSCRGAPSPGALTPPLCADIYLEAGCTVVIAGSRGEPFGSPAGLQLWSLSDIAARTGDCDQSAARIVNAYGSGPPLDVDLDDGTPLARGALFREPTGSRRLRAGALRVTVRDADAGALATITGALTPSHGHTLFLWGDARDTATGLDGLLVDDIPLALW